ncbi:uncharacterized protein LOC141685566 [Apium graveolens]|uniref:uncharacterized protein LOC141685566 n=1 Tax=Apium graveolens TaxID=4045 RepID=UPI003D79674E
MRAFGVPSGKFLGFLVSERGIEANSEKINAIMEMKIPRTQKDIQKLAGCLAALRRFIPKLEERCIPFFELLKGARNNKLLDWTSECHTTFEEVKQHLMNPPVLSKAKPGEPLSLYITAGPKAVSSALIREEGGIQSPIYYISQVPKDAETSGIDREDTNPGTESWKLFVDGSSTAEKSGAGLILISLEGFTIKQAIIFAFKATNHQAEYEALLSGLRLAKSLRMVKMIIYSDSQIVVKQTSGDYIAKDPKLAQYQAMVRDILETIPDITILQINREENSKEDELSKLVRNTSDLSSSVYFEELGAPSTKRTEVLCISSPDNWTTPYIDYMRDRTLPKDQNKAKYLKHKAARFFLKNGQLYRRTFSAPTLKCVDPEEANYCLREVHEGICGDHLAAKALAYKVIRQGYYWPTVHSDSIAYVKKCPQCQKFSNVPK